MTASTRQQVGERLKSVLNGTIAAAIVTVLGYFDDLTVGPIVIALAVKLPVLLTFAVTAVVYGFVQYWASTWLIDHWDEWIQGESGKRFDARLEKWRHGRLTQRLVEGVTGGSIFWYVVASLAFAAVNMVGIWKLSTDEPMPQRRIVLSAVVYATWCAALWTAAGYGIHVGISSA
jgi:hypothetical protein